MKISRNAWHYRLLVWCGAAPRRCRTLCEYWLLFVKSIAGMAIIGLFGTILGGVALTALAGMLYLLVSPALHWIGIAVDAGKLSAGYAGWMVLLGLAGIVAAASALVRLSEVGSAIFEDYQQEKCTRIEFED